MSDGAGRALVTGATGLIGRRVLPLLRDRGFEVHAIGRQGPVTVGRDVTWYVADLADQAAVERAIAAAQPTHLLHLAWNIRGDYWDSGENVRLLRDSFHLIDRFVESGGRRAVAAGTSAEYIFGGEADLSEESATRRDGLYAVCKNALREVAGLYCARRGVGFGWGRVFFCYGPGEDPSRDIPSLLAALERGERVPFEEGAGVRDYIYVDDVAEAFATLLSSDVNGVLNIGSGTGVTLRSFVTAVAEAAGRPGAVVFGARQTPSYQPERVVADIARIRAATGWHPRWSLKDGIRETVKVWQADRASTSSLR